MLEAYALAASGLSDHLLSITLALEPVVNKNPLLCQDTGQVWQMGYQIDLMETACFAMKR